MYETHAAGLAALKKVGAPRVRLELTTYRLTAGRAADCAIQELACYEPIPKKLRTACGDRTRDQSIKSRTLYLTELRRPVVAVFMHRECLVCYIRMPFRPFPLSPLPPPPRLNGWSGGTADTGDWSSGMILA